MPAAPPAQSVIDAILASSSYVTRRVEIYESDAVTRWSPDTKVRLLDGTITIDSTTTERRTLDLTLENTDGILDSYPNNFWYDKIIKVYRGVQIPVNQPKIAIIYDAGGTGDATALKTMLTSFGYTNVTVNQKIATFAQGLTFDVIVALGAFTSISSLPVRTLITQLYNAGKSIFTNGNDNDSSTLPLIIGTTVAKANTTPYRIEPAGTDNFASSGWITQDQSSDNGTLITALAGGVTAVALQTNYPGVPLGYTAAAITNTTSGGRWFHYHDYLAVIGSQGNVLVQRAFNWLDDTRRKNTSWEVQCGEFMIDDISKDNFPHTISIKGRDYTKKLLLSKFTRATTFTKGTLLDVVVKAIAANAGVSTTKMAVTGNGEKLGRDFGFERGVTRWDAISQLATAYNHNVYFDNTGVFVMGIDPDPAGKSTSFTFKTGAAGSLVSFSKSTNDSRIYNHVVIIGGAADTAPIYSEAVNKNNTTPTSVDKLGDRVYEYASSFITTQAQADALAKSTLARTALEEFNVDLQSIVLPWLDANQVVDFIDPLAAPGDPSRYLMTRIAIPLKLGPMSVTARRVIAITPA